VFPQAREGRCWFHKTANVLTALPKSAHPGAKKALAEIWGAEDKGHALAAVKAFEAAFGTKFRKAAAKITDGIAELVAFFDYPCEHWVHLRTTPPDRVHTVRYLIKGPARGPPGWPWRSSSSRVDHALSRPLPPQPAFAKLSPEVGQCWLLKWLYFTQALSHRYLSGRSGPRPTDGRSGLNL
jgi:hypothetical protein